MPRTPNHLCQLSIPITSPLPLYKELVKPVILSPQQTLFLYLSIASFNCSHSLDKAILWYHMPLSPMETPGLLSLLKHTATRGKRSKSAGGLFRMFKLFPLLNSGCKMVALLGRPKKGLLTNNGTTGTLFGYRKGRVSLIIQEDPMCVPMFVIELPMHTSLFHKEIASGLVRIALESENKTHKKQLLEEFVWAMYCNGRKAGYSIRRKQISDDELYVMQLLRGVSMGAGVLPSPSEKESVDGELTYVRARFDRVVGSKDSESFHMINPDNTDGPELSIFFVRPQ